MRRMPRSAAIVAALIVFPGILAFVPVLLLLSSALGLMLGIYLTKELFYELFRVLFKDGRLQ